MKRLIEQLENLRAYCNQMEYSLNKANTALREAQKIIESLEVDKSEGMSEQEKWRKGL